jgi:hypothetical protein
MISQQRSNDLKKSKVKRLRNTPRKKVGNLYTLENDSDVYNVNSEEYTNFKQSFENRANSITNPKNRRKLYNLIDGVEL